MLYLNDQNHLIMQHPWAHLELASVSVFFQHDSFQSGKFSGRRALPTCSLKPKVLLIWNELLKNYVNNFWAFSK